MNKNKNGQRVLTTDETQKTIGTNLNFAAAEAYKLLRTNLEFSLPAEDRCQIIGVTSALRGEGKSTTSINTAFSLAQTGRKVLLIEADLRLPTIAKRLQIRAKPGLTNLLVGQCKGNEVLQKSSMNPNLWVMTAGDIPPNPAELLGSNPMAVTIKAMSEIFDIIILDLPPVTAVSDALILSKQVDGMIIVIRQNYCTRAAVDETVRQIRFADAKILGFVLTGADTQKKGYGNYGDYRQYSSKESGK